MKDFSQWFNRLLNVNAKHGEFGLNFPMGSCCYRDLLRDNKVKVALKDAWQRLIIGGEEPSEPEEKKPIKNTSDKAFIDWLKSKKKSHGSLAIKEIFQTQQIYDLLKEQWKKANEV